MDPDLNLYRSKQTGRIMPLAHVCYGNRRSAGFSLLEVMIAIAIVAILASIAYPSYRDYIKRGKRAAAQSVLMDLAAR